MARIPSKAAAVLGAAASIALLSAPWASASTSGTQTFVLTSRSTAPNPVYQATATGPISATGTMQATSTASNAPLKAKFPKGTFLLNEVSAGHETGTINPSTCAAVYTETGITYTVSSGTGSYKGITGNGTASLRFTGTLPKLSNGKCNESTSVTPVAGTALTVLRARGPVTIP
jgi:hypothetical protein